jgi:tetratricopeptide (TPR) repeat protein
VPAAFHAFGETMTGMDIAGVGLRQLADTPALITTHFSWAAAFEKTPSRQHTKVMALDRALDELQLLRALWPTSPTARLCALRRLELSRKLGDHVTAAAIAQRYIVLHRDDPRLDNVLRDLADSAFTAGDHDGALAAASRLASIQVAIDGRQQPSPHRHFGVYLQGKIAHSRGDLDRAVAHYREIEQHYPDAAAVVRFYERKVLEVPSVVRVGLEGTAQLPLQYRNVAKLELALYKVDLLTLFMMRGGRETMRGVDLAGIKPTRTFERALPAAPGLSVRNTAVDLGELEIGAYWVVGRADDLEVSAFVIKSDIDLKVQIKDGRIHVHAFRGDKPAVNLQVRVAVAGSIVARGSTDARGLFSFALEGQQPAVIAFDDAGRYALWTGE